MSDRVGDLTKGELKEVIDEHTLSKEEMRAIVKEAVSETLTQLGVDTSSPIEMQRDFQHLRDWRMAQEVVKRKGYTALIWFLITGGIAAMWVGGKDFLFSIIRG